MTTAIAETRIARRYSQRDLHDLRRVMERWWTLLAANQGVGLSDSERAVQGAAAIALSHVRLDATGNYRLTTLQLKLFDEDAA